MGIPERLQLLRQRMQQENVDLYFIPTNDFHGSEYVNDYFKTREYISGFDGSAGSVVVSMEEAGLWTDGRYFLQAEAQLQGSGITLYKEGQEGVPKLYEYIEEKLLPGQTLGLDGRMVSQEWLEGLAQLLREKEVKMDISRDLVGDIWPDRPLLQHRKAWILPDEYAGESRAGKLARLRDYIQEKHAHGMVLTCLDDIAWLLNIRGNDIACTPVVLSYLVVTLDACFLFAGERIFSPEDEKQLAADGICLKPYGAIYDFVRDYPHSQPLLVDKAAANALLLSEYMAGKQVLYCTCPITLWKAVKNPTEIENEKKAHIRDGVAVTRFIYWIKQNIDKIPLTEILAAEKLEEFRREQEHYLEPSFEPIAGYAEHGAIVHYSATEETNARLLPENFLLLDTGGQYLEGTTDITRTILLGGKPTKEQKKYYTAVLRGNLNLCAAKFRYGCSGVALDYAARQPLWDMGCDYNHGTGHGVGYLLGVHEAPNAFRYRILRGEGKNAVLEAGMITSDEPGIYLEGSYGIRLENLILCVKREKNEYGQFMGFEPLTFVPFERDAIDAAQLSERERQLLNQYHEQVFEKIGGFLSRQEREWLADVCAPV
ncbi:MAG: aminopeptidase P family protein [Clostridiaceae bacterium]|nr:aminopeptidase P family protein [Clostridiaceae bacterium]